MAIDTSIYGLSGRGVKSVNDYDTEYEQLLGLRQNRQLGQMKMDEYQRGVKAAEEERAAYAQLMGQAGGDQARAAQLLMGSTNPGLYAKGAAIQKALLEARDKESEIAKRGSDAKKADTETRIKAHEFYIQQLGPVSDMAGAQRWLNGAVTAGVMSMQEAQAGLAALQQMGPQGLGEWKSKALQGGMSALQQIQEARQAAAAADTRANQTLVPDGKGGYIPNAPLIDAKARIAAAGASHNITYGSPVAGQLPDGTPVFVQPGNRGGPAVVMTTGDGTQVRPPPTKDQTKPLPSKVVTELKDARENAAAMDALASSFKPSFAGKGVLGLGADAQLGASANLGVDKDTVDWWKNYRKQAELVERHAMFGASLTQGEQGAWRSADISPGMAPDVVKRNLQTRQRLAKKVLESTVADMTDAGYDPQKVQAIGNRQGSASALAPAPAAGGWKIERE